jgi:hypothetical protein
MPAGRGAIKEDKKSSKPFFLAKHTGFLCQLGIKHAPASKALGNAVPSG